MVHVILLVAGALMFAAGILVSYLAPYFAARGLLRKKPTDPPFYCEHHRWDNVWCSLVLVGALISLVSLLALTVEPTTLACVPFCVEVQAP